MVKSEFMTVEELAKYLRIKNITLYKLAEKGKIPTSKVGRLWRFRKSGIETWLEEQKRKEFKDKKK